MADRYYVNSPLVLGPLTLTGPEARHIALVCRANPGDAVCLFNGDGHDYLATVQRATKQTVEFEITASVANETERTSALVIASAVPKGDRADFLIEKLTELGATRFVPLQTERSVVHPGPGKLDRFRRAVIEASKQCGRAKLMEIAPLTEWRVFRGDPSLPSVRIIAHPGASSFRAGSVSDRSSDAELRSLTLPARKEDIVFAIGPEGGWTDDELDCAWTRASLGPRILRVETAAIVAASLCSGEPPA